VLARSDGAADACAVVAARARGVVRRSRTTDARDVHRGRAMRGPARGLLAGLAAYKLGGGCLSTILVFILVYWALGYANC
jgi:hypothetical protein